jgi:hypothetical protein
MYHIPATLLLSKYPTVLVDRNTIGLHSFNMEKNNCICCESNPCPSRSRYTEVSQFRIKRSTFTVMKTTFCVLKRKSHKLMGRSLSLCRPLVCYMDAKVGNTYGAL